MEHRFSQKQKALQKMALTPQMRQSIKILGMSTKDLNDHIDASLEQNPFLKKQFEQERRQKSTIKPAAQEYDHMANIRQKEDPRALLLSQLKMAGLNDKETEIAEYLIYEMDENGYIAIGPMEVAEDSSASLETVEDVLEKIQAMEPAGIGARDITECLQIQLKRLGKEGSLEYTIVSEFRNELAVNDTDAIAAKTGADKEDVREAINNIKKLNPRPGSTILAKEAQAINPDLVAEVGKDGIQMHFNRSWLPHLQFYNPYENDTEIAQDAESKKFIKDTMNSAKRLIDDLTRREETIYKVAEYILDFQKESLIDEKQHIKTLIIDNVAHGLNLHKSTISRAVSNKYIQVNNKVIALKSLLSRGIQKRNGEITSKSSVKNKIMDFIRKEDKAKPLSDEKMQIMLEEEGITIKRRTVAKYRNNLRILPAYLRKKK